mgnify:FL=1
MSNIVAARRLRKSMLKDMDVNSFNLDNDILVNNIKSNRFNDIQDIEQDKSSIKKDSFKLTFKTKLLIKTFISIFIVFSCLIGKLIFPEQALSINIINKLKNEYKKDYDKKLVLEKMEDYCYSIYGKVGKYIIPDSLVTKIQTIYINTVKPKVINFNLKNLIEKTEQTTASTGIAKDLSSEEVQEVLNGMGGGEPIETSAFLEESSAVSMMQDDVGKILSKNINMIKPIEGTITSLYGARDQIFEGVNSYHTGLDIAAKSGTEIKSATDGKVIKVEEMNKYYGNNVLVEYNGVVFKYAHMLEIKVKLNDEIKQGDIIGLVGSTGMSTGPHLHFEISIDSRTVDPQKIISF